MGNGRRGLRLSYANVMSTIAVMVALGGTSYAALSLPNNSVTSKKIKNGAVHASDLARGAVTSAKLAARSVTSAKLAANAVLSGNIAPNAVTTSQIAANAVTTSQIADSAVTTSKLADASVTGTKIASATITESNVAPGSLNGSAFQCASGDEGLDNRHECFFSVGGAGLTWLQAVQQCRTRGSTPATLASPAEVQAAAALGGSPFASGTFWTSQIATVNNTPNFDDGSTAWAVETTGGTIVGMVNDPLSSNVIPKAACVYHAADES